MKNYNQINFVCGKLTKYYQQKKQSGIPGPSCTNTIIGALISAIQASVTTAVANSFQRAPRLQLYCNGAEVHYLCSPFQITS